jgi:serine/threonine-protein kinase
MIAFSTMSAGEEGLLRCPRCYRAYDPEFKFCAMDGEPLSVPLKTGPDARAAASQEVLGGRYLVRGFIGRGSTAKVYLGEDLEQKEMVAIKVLDAEFAKTRGAEERFFREARAAQRIGHPNVVRIVGLGHRQDGMPFLVMEFLFGESLGSRLTRDKLLSLEDGLVALRQAAVGLSAAHAVGIVHRDVKNDNLFLVGEPGAAHALKVLDFGLARVKELPSLTGLGMAIGTMEYMAPEQAVTEPTDARTDVYGLGVVMYRTLTGRLPFETKEDSRLLASQLAAEPPMPRAILPELDAKMERVIWRAMRKHPENRYPSMELLIEDLDRVAGKASGPLYAEKPLAHDPDVYRPTASFARAAAHFFYKQLGLPPSV